MSQDKAEIQRELEHIDRLLTIAHNNRRTLEEQQIKSGSMLRLELSNQLSDIKTAIQELEERKNSLEIQAVEEDYSLAEAEYRVIAARAWEEGVLSSLGGAELQLSRLRLKIPKVRADQIEHEIRTELTRSLFSTVSLEILWQRLTTSNKQMFNLVYTMIKLNHCEFFDMTCRSLEVFTTVQNFRANFRASVGGALLAIESAQSSPAEATAHPSNSAPGTGALTETD